VPTRVLDRVAPNRLGAEHEAVRFNRQVTDLAEDVLEPGDGVVASPKEVQIARGPVRLITPQLEEHRTLEHEDIAVLRLAQAIQQAFQGVAGEDKLEVLVLLPRQIHQSLPHRRRQVARPLLGHARDSR
jgi:hypothetical protein